VNSSTSETPSVDIILPLYRTEPFIDELTQRLSAAMGAYRTTLIAVDDRSPDQSSELIRRAAKKSHLACTVIRHDSNRGQHQAVLTGLAISDSDFSVAMDADLQDPPEVVPSLVKGLIPTARGIAFARRTGTHRNWFEKQCSEMFKRLVFRKMGINISPAIGMFFAMTSLSRHELLQLPASNAYLPAMLLASGHPNFLVDYKRCSSSRSSSYSLLARVNLARRAIHWVTNYNNEAK